MEPKLKVIEYAVLEELLKEQILENLDLTGFDFETHTIDFSLKHLKNIDFSKRTIKGCIFESAVLIECNFKKAVMENCSFKKKEGKTDTFQETKLHKCDFTEARMNNCDFTEARMNNCNFIEARMNICHFKKVRIDTGTFREAIIDIGDFRYADITNSTFQRTMFSYVDFYRAAFKGITIFQDAKIENSSLNYVLFETYCITRDNLKESDSDPDKKQRFFKKHYFLLQENEAAFGTFWDRWTRIDPMGKNWTDEKERSLNFRYLEAERIYRQFSALWESKGYNSDAEWAYLQAKRMERRHLFFKKRAYNETKGFRKIRAFGNLLIDILFGYGVSLWKVFRTYIGLIIIFGVLYYFVGDLKIPDNIEWTFFTMIGAGHGIKIQEMILKILSFLQTGLGMLLTGFMGFVLANKIRKS